MFVISATMMALGAGNTNSGTFMSHTRSFPSPDHHHGHRNDPQHLLPAVDGDHGNR